MGRGWKRVGKPAPRQSFTRQAFFETLKQSLRIKTFVGTSENAVLIQIWTALIATLVVKYLQLRSTFFWSLSNLVALLRQQLFIYRDLWSWINAPFQRPPGLNDAGAEQLRLFDEDGRAIWTAVVSNQLADRGAWRNHPPGGPTGTAGHGHFASSPKAPRWKSVPPPSPRSSRWRLRESAGIARARALSLT